MLIKYFIASSLKQSLFNFVNENPVLKEDKIEEKSKKKKKGKPSDSPGKS